MQIFTENLMEIKTAISISLILIAAAVLTRFVRWIISKTFKTASSKMKVDPTYFKFFTNAMSMVIWIIAIGAIISMVPKLKAFTVTLFAGAGILVAVVGFAAQQAFSNIISGIFIVIFKPFKVGDRIKVGSLDYGIVEDITLRHTIINNYENKRIIIPNSVISSETIVNDSIEEAKVCRWVEIGISYDSDIDLACEILHDIAASHPACIDVRTEEDIAKGAKKVNVRFMSFGDFSINLRAYVWTDDPYNAGAMHSQLNHAIKKRFDAAGIEIPFPYRTLVFKNEPASHPQDLEKK